MLVRWTTDAADDLERICDYIAETSPDSARRVAKTIVEGIASLHTFPHRGRLGRVEGTREFVVMTSMFMRVISNCAHQVRPPPIRMTGPLH